MKIGRIFHILVFVTAVLVFSMSFVTFAQQNSELFKTVIAAEQDAKTDVNQFNWWLYGSCLIGVIASQAPQPSPERLIGKSPEYVEVYTQAYKEKAQNLRLSAAVPGCLTTVFSGCILSLIPLILDEY